jgi:hypothetical protein
MNLETNDRAVLGAFTPTQSRSVTLEAESATVNLSATSDTAIGYDATRNDAGDALIVEYADPATSTDTLKFMIHERFNDSNVLLQNQSFSDLGNLSYSEPLSPAEQNTSWVVELYWDRDGDGSYEHAHAAVGQGPRDLVPVSLDRAWRAAAGVVVLFITALLFSELNLGVGAITTAITGSLLWYIGLLQDVTTGPAVVLALGVAAIIHYYQGGSV